MESNIDIKFELIKSICKKPFNFKRKTIQVLLYIITHSQGDTFPIKQSYMAEKIGLDSSDISKNIKELKNRNILMEHIDDMGVKAYSINYNKGTWVNQ